MAAKAKTGFSGLDKSKTLAENTVNAGPVVLDSNVTFTGTPAPDKYLNSFSATLSNPTEYDHLYISEIGGITYSEFLPGYYHVYYNGQGIGTYSPLGGAEAWVDLYDGVGGDAITALARSVVYSYSGDAPSAAARTITFKGFGPDGNPTTATMQLKLKPENDAPVFSGLDAQSIHSASQAAAGVVIDADVHVANPDLTGFRGGKLAVHLAGATATDQLYLSDGHFSITGKKLYLDGKQVGTVSADGHNGHDLAFTFSAAISDAQASQLAEQVSYRSTAASAPDGARDVTFTLTDAEKSATSAHTALVFQADAPMLLSASVATPDAFAALKAAFPGEPDELGQLFATLEARAAGLLEATSGGHGPHSGNTLSGLHLPVALADALDAIAGTVPDHATHAAPLQGLSDHAAALAAHVQEALHPLHVGHDALI